MMNVLIVDDEYLARRLLASYVASMPDLHLVAQCGSALEAYALIAREAVDIVLLDIHMPDLSGLELARMLAQSPRRPAVIFTTAYGQYALDSYDLDAADYLLKPIAPDRFAQAIEKARRLVAPQAAAVPQAAERPTFLMVKADHRHYKIELDDLRYVEGQHEYVSFYTGERRVTALYSLKALEQELPADRFVRVHKSYIVGLRYVTERTTDTLTVAGRKIPVGGSYRDAVARAFGL